MEVVKVEIYKNGDISCYKCDKQVEPLKLYQIRDPLQDYPQYWCDECMATSRQ